MRVARTWTGMVLLMALCTFGVAAQSISGPSLGFVSDEQGTTIWPLLGILGASVPGQPLALPESIARASISPQHDYAVAIAAASGQPVIIRLDPSNISMGPLAGVRLNPGLIAISPTGSAVALYGSESNTLQVVAGLPGEPQIAHEFNTSGLGGDVRHVAVSDDASMALVTAGGDSPTLWLLNVNGATSPVSVMQPSQVAFMARRSDAVIADNATQEVFLLQGLDGNPVRSPGIVFRESGRPFSAVNASSDGRWIFVAQEDSPDITVVNLESRATAMVSCHCRPTTIFPLKGTSVFRLNGLSNGPISVLDASSTSPRTLIIPVDPNLVAGHREQ